MRQLLLALGLGSAMSSAAQPTIGPAQFFQMGHSYLRFNYEIHPDIAAALIAADGENYALDLAWITLRPSDFPEPGYLNTTRSAWEDRWEAPQTLGGGLEGFLLILDAQVNAGWIQAHRAAITLPEAPGSEWAARKAFIHLTQLSSAEGAAYYLSEYCDALYPAYDFTEVAAEVAEALGRGDVRVVFSKT